MRTIAVLNWKGGSGKTTTALALSVGLARRFPKQRLLLVDSDPAHNASLVMLSGLRPEKPTLTDVLMDEADAIEAIKSTRVPNLDILPSDTRLAECTAWLADELGRERRLRVALRSVEERYSICVVDSPPQFSLISLNVLAGVDQVIVPIDPGVFSIHGLGRLQETIDSIRRHLEHPELAIIGLLMTKTSSTRSTISSLRESMLWLWATKTSTTMMTCGTIPCWQPLWARQIRQAGHGSGSVTRVKPWLASPMGR
jgi:chromosome partitioning protein